MKKDDVLFCHYLFGGGIKDTADRLNLSMSATARALNTAKKTGYDWKQNKDRSMSKNVLGVNSDKAFKYLQSCEEVQGVSSISETKGPKKVIVLPDVHYPDNISLSGIEEFMADYKPDVVIYLGDLLDLPYLSSFDKDNKLIARDKMRKEFDEIMAMMDKHRELCAASEVYYIEGNHEERLRRYLAKNPVSTEFIEISLAMKLKERDIKWIEINKWVRLGQLFFTHGYYYNIHHANKHVNIYQRNLIYGHTHTWQVFSGSHPFDKALPHIAKSIGCLCNLNPAYMKNKPNQWVNSFYIAEIEEDETFTDSVIPIVNGSFRVVGLTSRRYSANV